MPQQNKNKMKRITLKHIENNQQAIITQEYYVDMEFGHWKFIIVNMHGDILHVSQSAGSPPDKIDQDFCKKLYDRFYHDWLRKEKNRGRRFCC